MHDYLICLVLWKFTETNQLIESLCGAHKFFNVRLDPKKDLVTEAERVEDHSTAACSICKSCVDNDELFVKFCSILIFFIYDIRVLRFIFHYECVKKLDANCCALFESIFLEELLLKELQAILCSQLEQQTWLMSVDGFHDFLEQVNVEAFMVSDILLKRLLKYPTLDRLSQTRYQVKWWKDFFLAFSRAISILIWHYLLLQRISLPNFVQT